MKYLITLLLVITFNANAACYTDNTGFFYCDPVVLQPLDFRNSTNSPKIYENGRYMGNLNGNQYDPNSVSNPYGRYGSPYSPDSINNPYRVRR